MTLSFEAVRVVALGPLPPRLPRELVERLSRRLSVPCRLGLDRAYADPPCVPGREQIDADRLLERLEADPVEAGTVLLGLTSRDIAIPIFTFVFGRARSLGHAAVVSIARLDPAFYGLPPDHERTTSRAVDEALHEIGHVFGLPHCRESACLMRFAGFVEQVDARGSSFCGACAERIDSPAWPARTRPT